MYQFDIRSSTETLFQKNIKQFSCILVIWIVRQNCFVEMLQTIIYSTIYILSKQSFDKTLKQ